METRDIFVECEVGLALDQVVRDIQEIVPPDIFNMKDFYFAGGCIYCLWNNKPVKDYDIFCRNKAALKKLKLHFKKNRHLVNYWSNNAITVGKYQFVILHVGAPEDEVAKFDFKHNCYYYDGKSIHSIFGWEHITTNQLIFNDERARDLFTIIGRIPKFLERGMTISQMDVLNILEVCTRLPRVFRERASLLAARRGKGRY